MLILANRPGLSSFFRLGYKALTTIVRVSISIFGSIAYTEALKTLSLPSILNSIGYPGLTSLAYLSGIANSILSGLVLTSLTIFVDGVAKLPSLNNLKPIIPSKGDLSSVSAILA